jgi:hypothetical protein
MLLLSVLFVATRKYLQASGPKLWLLFESSSSGIQWITLQVMQKFSDVLWTNIVNPHLTFWDPGGATYFLDMGRRYIVNRLVFLWLYQNVWIASVGQIKPESKVKVKAIGRMTLQLQFYHQALDDP